MFTGLTAFAAVLMFIFKDALLGLIAGIQMSANDILRVGDYIEMPSRDVDGTVVDISLSTVKIHNTNLTLTTVPTYAFVSESFWNWRGLEITSGRRIKRYIQIDMQSIKYCDNTVLERLKEVQFPRPFFEQKETTFDQEKVIHNKGHQVTNISLFRSYIEAYLKSNPHIDTKMTVLVHNLQSTENGLPLEIYVYTNEKNAQKFERIQSDIFDHLIAIMPLFDLKVFQRYSGNYS